MNLVEQLELKDKKIDHLTKVIIEQDEIIEQRNVMLSRAYSEYEYAKSVTVNLWEKHYKAECPNWEPCEDLLGLVSQLSNMHTGLVRIERIEALEAERDCYLLKMGAYKTQGQGLQEQLAASEKQAIKATAANINLNEQLASAQAELAEANATIEEQIKVRHAWELDNMALTGKLEAARAEITGWKQDQKDNHKIQIDQHQQILALKVENLKLREAIEGMFGSTDTLEEDRFDKLSAALSTPSDTTALTEYRNGVLDELSCFTDVLSKWHWEFLRDNNLTVKYLPVYADQPDPTYIKKWVWEIRDECGSSVANAHEFLYEALNNAEKAIRAMKEKP